MGLYRRRRLPARLQSTEARHSGMAKSLFEKLQWKASMVPALILRAPDGFDPYVEGLPNDTDVVSTLRGKGPYPFLLAFVRSSDDIETLTPKLVARAGQDGVVWFAYPKKSSPRFKTDISRESGWLPLDKAGFVSVRQVALDEDWSALRFRRAAEAPDAQRRTSKKVARPVVADPKDLGGIFRRLKELVGPHIKGMPNLTEGPDTLSVDSRDTAPNGTPLQFLSLMKRKKSVNVYLMPIYVNPDLAERLPPRLAKRRQGKSCFNFPMLDEDCFAELEALIDTCKKRWKKDGRL